MKNRFHLWDNIETIFLPEIEEYSTKALNFWISKAIMEIIPTGMEFEAAGLDYSDLKYILNGTESLDEDKDSLEPGTYPCDVYKCKCLVREYLENNTEESLDRFIRLLKKSYGERKKETDPTLVQIAEMTLCMPARVFLYLAAELMPEIDFWKLWKEHKDMVYHDEKIKAYAPDEIVAWRTERREMPIAPVRTSDFLKQDDGFTFWHTPDEIKHKPNYYLSDDDRMYWWDGTDEVIISEKTKDWLRELARQHKEIMENQDLSGISEGFIRYFIDTVSEANEYYKRIYPFQSMFYEFLENKQKTEYIVALKLFRNLVDSDDYRKEGAIIKYANGRSWDITSRNVTHNEARIKLKRYLSVMANVDLRKKYFGF